MIFLVGKKSNSHQEGRNLKFDSLYAMNLLNSTYRMTKRWKFVNSQSTEGRTCLPHDIPGNTVISCNDANYVRDFSFLVFVCLESVMAPNNWLLVFIDWQKIWIDPNYSFCLAIKLHKIVFIWGYLYKCATDYGQNLIGTQKV